MKFPEKLPDSWELTTLEHVAYIEMGQSPDSRLYNINGVGLPFFQGKAEFGVRYPEIRKWCSEPTKIAEAGDVLLSIRAPVGPINIAIVRCCIGRGLAAIRAEFGVNPLYLFYFFRHIESWLSEQGTGSTFAAISGQFVKQLECVIAPTNEQCRIVEKLEELFSDLNAGVAELKAAQKKLAQYRQSLLKAAVTGELTAEWRRNNIQISRCSSTEATASAKRPPLYERGDRGDFPPDEIPLNPTFIKGDLKTSESGAQLLERILKERRTRWEEKQLAKFKEQDKTPPKGWQDKYPEPVRPDTANLPELPQGWVWTGFEELADGLPNSLKAGPFGSALKKDFYVSKGYKIYGQEQVIRDNPYYGNYYVSKDKYDELISCAVQPGDILVSLVGTTGKVLVLPDDAQAGIINPRLLKISLLPGNVEPSFIKLILESPYARLFFKLNAHGGTMEILNLGILKALPVMLPSIDEQKQIVKTVNEQKVEIDRQDAAIEQSLAQSAAQRKNILKSAFSGQLVPQDPDDEPASVLLARIRAERAARTTNKKPQRRTKRKEVAHD